MIQRDLVFDVGLNHGEDTSYYLQKGFRVIAIEANPLLSEECRQAFNGEIADGRLVIISKGIAAARGRLPFYRNLSNDHWSSFDPVYGCRDGSKFEIVEIDCVTLEDIVIEHGLPRYIKIDVEGVDRSVVSQLSTLQQKPTFASCEEYGRETILDFANAGYDRFQLARQRLKQFTERLAGGEGVVVGRNFTGYDSGPFGLDLPSGGWLTAENALHVYDTLVRNRDRVYIGPEHEWFDVHAGLAIEVGC